VSARLKSPEDGADSEFDSRLGTDGNQNQTASVEKGRRTTPPFSLRRPESRIGDSGREDP
jgi:hypothetical protein